VIKYWKTRPRTRKGWVNLYVSYLKRIPQRHYFPIFVILSLYFVVPYSEFVVTAMIPIYFFFEKQVRWVADILPLPNYVRVGCALIFFLVMIDDYLFYFAIMAFIVWSRRQVKERGEDISQ
jgi:hypothetical protein